jgi:trigger factor
VKTDLEELSPTRVKLTIEVPFDELKQSLDRAYREVARQVRVPGFRPGKVPPRVIDARIGRGAVLEQAVNDAVPQLYSKAVTEHEVVPLDQPEFEVTKLEDGQELAFTAEVDVRPKFELPELDTLSVTVENAEVSPDQVEQYLTGLRERFASLKTVDRPVQEGDYVAIDLAASIDGKPVEDAQATGVSYEVGSESMLDGLDEALTGMTAEESKTFTAELAGGEYEGRDADIQVTVHSVKVKELPELDDEFAQSASEYDTVGELRAATRKQLEAMRKSGQAGQARQRALEALLDLVDMPLPERIVEMEISSRRENMKDQLERASVTMQSYLESRGQTPAQLSAELETDARRAMKAQFILDKLAADAELQVSTEDLSTYVAQQAYQLGVAPDRLAKQLSDSGRLPEVAGDVLRSHAMDLLARRAKITDEAGRQVQLAEEDQEAATTDAAEPEPAEAIEDES